MPYTFIFRYALCAYLHALHWIEVGGAKDRTSRAVELLMKAAETGTRADRKAATEQLMTVLQDRQLC